MPKNRPHSRGRETRCHLASRHLSAGRENQGHHHNCDYESRVENQASPSTRTGNYHYHYDHSIHRFKDAKSSRGKKPGNPKRVFHSKRRRSRLFIRTINENALLTVCRTASGYSPRTP